MARPSKNLDLALIKAGKILLKKEGASGFSIRKLCSKAKVNPGMFSYFFKNRDAFMKRVFSEMYDDFFSTLTQSSNQGTTAIDQLRLALRAIALFMRSEKKMLRSLFRDALNAEKVTVKMLSSQVPLHLKFMEDLISKCKSEGFFSPKIANFQILSMLGPSVLIPILFSGEMEDCGAKLGLTQGPDFLSDESIDQRIDIILKGFMNASL